MRCRLRFPGVNALADGKTANKGGIDLITLRHVARFHSYLNATMGSTFDARRAGR